MLTSVFLSTHTNLLAFPGLGVDRLNKAVFIWGDSNSRQCLALEVGQFSLRLAFSRGYWVSYIKIGFPWR